MRQPGASRHISSVLQCLKRSPECASLATSASSWDLAPFLSASDVSEHGSVLDAHSAAQAEPMRRLRAQVV